MTKTCTFCGEEKGLELFYTNRNMPDGKTSRCKSCLYSRVIPVKHAKILERGSKQCPECKQELPLHSFYKRGEEAVDYSSYCKPCNIKRSLEYYYTKEPRKAAARIRESLWRLKMKTQGLCTRCGLEPLHTQTSCLACNEKRQKVAREKKIKQPKEYSERHKQLLYCWKERVCTKCCDEPAVEGSNWGITCKRQLSQRSAERAKALRLRALEKLGHVCACCGETGRQFLNFDHINGDGKGDRNPWKLHKSILEGRDDIRILCFNCNLGRELNGGICPHQVKVTA